MNEYYNKFVDFCKRYGIYDERVFKYLRNNSYMFDYRDEDYRRMICTQVMYDNNKASDVSMVVPFITDDITVLINIHEYTHGVIYYNMLGEEYNPKTERNREILPMLYERLFVLENEDNKWLVGYENYLEKRIIDSDDEDYKLGLICRDEIIKNCSDFNFNNLNRRTNGISRRVRILKKIDKMKSYLR